MTSSSPPPPLPPSHHLTHLLSSQSFSPQNYINALFKDHHKTERDDVAVIPESMGQRHDGKDLTRSQHNKDAGSTRQSFTNSLLQHHQSTLHNSLSTLSSKIQYLQQSSTDFVTLDELEFSVTRLMEQLTQLVQRCNQIESDRMHQFTNNALQQSLPSSPSVGAVVVPTTPSSSATPLSASSSSGDPYQHLKQWYSIRQKLEHCCKVLHAAQIVSEGIESVQKSIDHTQSLMDDDQALKVITTKLIAVTKALFILEQGGYESYFTHQKELVHRFELRLEDIMRERFIEIMRKRTRWLSRGQSQDMVDTVMDEAKREARMLAQCKLLDRVFKQYVERECKEPIVKVWQNIAQASTQQIKGAKPRGGAPFSDKLSTLYDEILSFLNKDATLFNVVFQDTAFTPISTFITDILTSLSPPLITLMQDQGSLPDMIQCFEQSKQFCSRVQSIMRAHSPIRNDSAKLQKEIDSVESQILLPFQQLQGGYASLEQQYFNSFLDEHLSLYKYHSIDVDTLEEFVSGVQDSMDIFFTTLRGGSERCLRFTSGKEYPALVRVIENEIRRFAAKISGIMSRFESSHLNIDQKNDNRHLIQLMLQFYQVNKNLVIRAIEFTREMQREILEHSDEICDNGMFPITNDKKQELEHFLTEAASDDLSMFKEGIERMRQMYQQSICLAESALILPVRQSLRSMSTLSVWNAKSNPSAYSLPDMHFSPLDYIQRIYQHLVDLPGDLQMLEQDTSIEHDVEIPNWLELVCASTVKFLKENILQIPLLTKDGRRQLISDVAHFSPLLQILVQRPEPSLQELQKLLQCETKSEFDDKRRQCTHLSHDFLRRLKKIFQF